MIAGLDLSAEPERRGRYPDRPRPARDQDLFGAVRPRPGRPSCKNAARLHKDPLKSAGFRVLRAPDVPSVLVELGYVSNKQDLQSLTSEAWRGRTADAIAQAVDTFFTTRLAGRPRFGPN